MSTTFHRTRILPTSRPRSTSEDSTLRLAGTPPVTRRLPTGTTPDPIGTGRHGGPAGSPTPRADRPSPRGGSRTPTRLLSAAVALGLIASLLLHAQVDPGTPEPLRSTAGLSSGAAITLSVFIAAVWCWIFSGLDDTYVALAAGVALVLLGPLPAGELFGALGHESVWLLVAAFVIATAVSSTGLAARGAAFVITAAGTPRSLAHLTTLSLVVTAFAVPSTSGRAALALPIFLALRAPGRPDSLQGSESGHSAALVKMLAVLFPTVILLSAVGSYLGAGAHLITSQVLESSGHRGFDFAGWMLLGLPLALVSSHVACEVVLLLFTGSADRRVPVRVGVAELESATGQRLRGPLAGDERRCLMLIVAVVLLWCSQPLHGLHPALVALIGAMVACAPGFGTVRFSAALKSVPWSLLVFMATTLALASTLVTTGAADWMGHTVLERTGAPGAAAPWLYVVTVVVLSAAAHLVIASRSARSAVLIPIVIASAPAVGVDPVAAALASTAAAGFCHTMTSSAKPVAIFSRAGGETTYQSTDLLRLSAWLGPISVLLVLAFSVLVWPHLGLPLFTGP